MSRPRRSVTALTLLIALLIAMVGGATPSLAQEAPTSHGFQVSDFELTADGSTLRGSYSITAQERVTIPLITVAVRDSEGGTHDLGIAQNVSLRRGQSRTVEGERTKLAAGTYTAVITYTMNGSSWPTASAVRTVTIGAQEAPDSPTSHGFQVSDFELTADGSTLRGSYSITAQERVTIPLITVAVRDSEGGTHDLGIAQNVSLRRGQSRTVEGERTKLAAGTYTAVITYTMNGSSWPTASAVRTVTIGAQAPAPSPTFGPDSGRPFATDSPWNKPIPASPRLDANNAAISTYLGSNSNARVAAAIYAYGVPIYHANASTPRHEVTCTAPWGACGFANKMVPIPSNAVPSIGSDRAMAVIDWSTGLSWDFWLHSRNSTGHETGWGDVGSIHGDGTGPTAVGAGVSRLAGVVRIHEIQQGVIDHALVFSTNNSCRRDFRYPATKTDGSSSRSDCIPEGARVQLDPSINVDAIPNITAGEKMVAKALQKYGAYNIDNGGARMAFIFETPKAGQVDPYRDAGFRGDHDEMSNIPWHRLRVLDQWDGR